MNNTDFVELILTCDSLQEAHAIADSLLEKHLVACVEFIDIKSKYHWQGRIEEADEIKLIMETVAANFDQVESEVARLHSYKTFVLQMIPLARLSSAAAAWLTKETNLEEVAE